MSDKKIELLISDWDGTIVQSMQAYSKSFAKVLENNFNISQKQSIDYYFRTSGEPLTKQFTESVKILKSRKISDTKTLEDQFWKGLEGFNLKAIPGAKEFFKEIKKKGIKIAVWSGTKTDVLRKAIKKLSFRNLVDFSIGNTPGSEEEIKGKGLFKVIRKELNLNPNLERKIILVIGDGKSDIRSGKEIGAITAGFVRDKDPQELLAQGADFVFKNFDQLLEYCINPNSFPT